MDRSDADRIRSLEAELTELRTRLAALEHQAAAGTPAAADRPAASAPASGGGPPDTAPVGPDHAPSSDGRVDRRRLLTRAGAATAGAVAAATLLGTEPAAAAQGTFDGAPAVTGTGAGGDGVVGTTNTTTKSGVYGSTSTPNAVGITARHLWEGNALEAYTTGNGTGVLGTSESGIGVFGSVTNGTGVSGYATTGHGVRAVSSHGQSGANLFLQASKSDPRSLSAEHYMGEIIADVGGSFWACVASGTPGTWRRFAGPTTSGALCVFPTPVRVYDSRPGFPPATTPKSPMTNATTRVITCVSGGVAPPNSMTAALVNLTVTNTSSAGFVALFQGGASWPGNSTINWDRAGATIANSAFVAASSLNQISAYCAGSTHIIVDMLGYLA